MCGCFQSDAVDGLTHLLGPSSVQEVWTSSPTPGPRSDTASDGSSIGRSPTWSPADCDPAGCGGWPLTGRTTRSRCAAVLDAQPQLVNEGGGRRRLGGAVPGPSADPVRAARDRGGSDGPRPALPAPMSGPAPTDAATDRGPRSGAVATRRPLRRNRLLRLGEPAGPPHGAGGSRALAGSSALPARAAPTGVRRPHRRGRARPRAGRPRRSARRGPARLRRALLRRLRRALPADLAVTAVRRAPAGFDARFGAIWRRYCYRISDAITVPDPAAPPRHDRRSPGRWTSSG